MKTTELKSMVRFLQEQENRPVCYLWDNCRGSLFFMEDKGAICIDIECNEDGDLSFYAPSEEEQAPYENIIYKPLSPHSRYEIRLERYTPVYREACSIVINCRSLLHHIQFFREASPYDE